MKRRQRLDDKQKASVLFRFCTTGRCKVPH